MSRTALSNRNQERDPAYDSSPRITAAHWFWLMAEVPESVRRSMSTSSAASRKTL